MAASRLLGAAAAVCVLLFSFAAGHRKSYWCGSINQGCDSVLSADFLNFGAGDFPFKVLFKKCFKIFQNRIFLALASRSGFGAAISDAVARSSFVFCNLAFANRIVMAASRLLGAAAACVILLSFAAGHCKS